VRAEQHVRRLVKRGTFDAVTDLARAVPISIVLDLLGFPMEGRDQLLGWGENSLNALGPVNRSQIRPLLEGYLRLIQGGIEDLHVPTGDER
jgi:cytochrome P450